MHQLGELDQEHDAFAKLDSTVLAIHCECPPSGTARLEAKKKFRIDLANDDHLNVVGKYSVTSTYLIDKQGIIRARWLDRIHKRVGAGEILKAISKLEQDAGSEG